MRSNLNFLRARLGSLSCGFGFTFCLDMDRDHFNSSLDIEKLFPF